MNRISLREMIPHNLMRHHKLAKSVVRFLASQQASDGSFPSLSSASKSVFDSARSYKTTFFTSLILDCLCSVDIEGCEKIRSRAAAFLLKQKGGSWSFNYWARDAETYAAMPYPDDLDDTFCALSALFKYDPALISGSALASIVRILNLCEAREGGPYRTWIVRSNSALARKDIDLAVNANVAYFLFLLDVYLPNINKLMDDSVLSGNFKSSYYPSAYPVIYFMSRSYKGAHSAKFVERILAGKPQSKNFLEDVLGASALLNLSCPPKKLKKYSRVLLQARKQDWQQPYPFCFDPSISGKQFYAGSAALTAALYLEALNKFGSAASKKKASGLLAVSKEKKIHSQVISKIGLRSKLFGSELRKSADEYLSKIVQSRQHSEAILMPYRFQLSLGLSKPLSRKNIVNLCLANIYGWIAYDIYDDFMDNEGNSNLLPLANVYMRELQFIYHKIFGNDPQWLKFYGRVMDFMESSDAWELKNTRAEIKGKFLKISRLPDYSKHKRLYGRSLGYSLAPLAALRLAGFNLSSGESVKTMSFFKHYLAAKQLNDDAHDWLEDLSRGFLNSAAVIVLKELKKTKINLVTEREKMQRIFWQRAIKKITRKIFMHTCAARTQVLRSEIIKNKALLSASLEPLELAANKAVNESKLANSFLRSYKG